MFERFSPSKNSDWVWCYIFLPALITHFTLLITELNNKQITGSLEILDINFNQIILNNTKIEIIAEGFQWCEGPLWINNENSGYLLISDTITNQIWKWEEGNGLFPIGKTLFIQNSGCKINSTWCNSIFEPGSNGLLLFKQQTEDFIVCEHGNRRIGIIFSNNTYVPLASHYNNLRLNSPNDAIFSSKNHLYFTDPPYGLYHKETNEITENDIPFNGIYMIHKNDIQKSIETKLPTNNVILLDSSFTRPNGIHFSPDFKKLYVANSDKESPIWKVFDVRDDGKIENGKVFFDSKYLLNMNNSWGNPDGFKVDSKGNLYASGPGGVLIISPNGVLLGRILLNEKVSNVAFGGDGYLYITATDKVLRIKVLSKPISFK